MYRSVLVKTAITSDSQHALIQLWTRATAWRPLVQALGMQAEHHEKEASSEDGTPASQAAGLRCNTGEIVAHIYLLAVAFP